MAEPTVEQLRQLIAEDLEDDPVDPMDPEPVEEPDEDLDRRRPQRLDPPADRTGDCETETRP